MSYWTRIISALTRDGTDLDVTENAVLDGAARQTISMRCAIAQQAGRRWGCVACWLLGVLVQRRHCTRQLIGLPMTPWNYLRAVVALIAVPVALIWAAVELLRLVV